MLLYRYTDQFIFMLVQLNYRDIYLKLFNTESAHSLNYLSLLRADSLTTNSTIYNSIYPFLTEEVF